MNYSHPDYKRLNRSQWDLRDLIESLGPRLDAKDVSTAAILDQFENWAKVIGGVVIEFMPRPRVPPSPAGGATN